MNKVMISPSILSADFGHLRASVEALDRCNADRIHIDIMDGHFVPGITFGAKMVAALRSATKIPFEAHLMVSDPGIQAKAVVAAGADIVIVHHEACADLEGEIAAIESQGAKAGVAINPQTTFDSISSNMGSIDTLMIMGVDPGMGGQKFMPVVLDKIRQARAYVDKNRYGTIIAVDGGINIETGRLAMEAGASELVAGSAIFGAHASVSDSIEGFRKLCWNH
jgi:ribulose-phosphate 3-epimerase